MFSALLALLVLPFSDLSKLRGVQFRPLSKIAFFIFVANFLILMQLGAKHVESPFIELGQISTVLYFAHFVLIVPFITLLENSLIDLAVYNPIYLSKFQINVKKIVANRLSGFTLYPAGLATAFSVVIGLSSFVYAL
jgi:ubiquinol-cytochrome c reductase cytochrome b subunit